MSGFRVTILDNSAEWLRPHGRNFTSQFGEDGYVQALFGKIGTANLWCFEVGAADGLFYSNTKRLRDEDWRAVLIEADKKAFTELEKLKTQKTQTIWARVQPRGIASLDSILSRAGAPPDLDFGCIDIDGHDYYVWEGMTAYKPRVMLVEFSPYGSPDDTIETSKEGQAGLNPIVALGRSKGYTPLLHTYCNVLFAREDAWKTTCPHGFEISTTRRLAATFSCACCGIDVTVLSPTGSSDGLISFSSLAKQIETAPRFCDRCAKGVASD